MTGLRAATLYEFRMQIHKVSLWIAPLGLAIALSLLQGDQGPLRVGAHLSARQVMGLWAVTFGILLPIAAGMVLADRGVRDRRLQVEPLLESLPTGYTARLTGKYLGAVAATALPPLLALVCSGAFETLRRGDPAALGWALVAFALVTLPGLVFLGGFALTCPRLLSAPLFRVLFLGYWFWGNLTYPPLLPSLSGTPLTPVGDYPASWLEGKAALYAGTGGALRPDVSAATTVLSIALLLVGGALPLVVGAALRARANAR
jgi:hypothetical protein